MGFFTQLFCRHEIERLKGDHWLCKKCGKEGVVRHPHYVNNPDKPANDDLMNPLNHKSPIYCGNQHTDIIGTMGYSVDHHVSHDFHDYGSGFCSSDSSSTDLS